MIDPAFRRLEPSEAVRQLALVPDERLAADIRAAVVAIGWWYEAWWAEQRATASKYDHQRAGLVVTARDQMVMLGGGATLDELVQVATPLLNPFWPKAGSPAANLASAVELLRDVIMHRIPHIRHARQEVAQYRRPRG